MVKGKGRTPHGGVVGPDSVVNISPASAGGGRRRGRTSPLGGEKTSGKAKEPAPQAPEEPAAAPAPEENSGTEEISDATLREKVKEAKDRTDTKTVRALFAEFGINNSTECPQERRSELLAGLEKLR